MTSLKEWYLGARPKTLPAAMAPVIAGTGLAAAVGRTDATTGILALVVALAIQIATNYSNDYSDGIRGTDDNRVGPMRLVASGVASAPQVRLVAVAFFVIAAAAGLVLASIVSPWLIVVGAASIAAGWLYTGGPKPYGYYGFGELFVFVFFGLVATCGTYFVQVRSLSVWSIIVGTEMGLLSVAILVANNLRDIDNDQVNGKKTLAVRMGDSASRKLYTLLLLGSFVCILLLEIKFRYAFIGLLSALSLKRTLGIVRSGAKGRDLLPVLAGTSQLLLVQAAFLAIGLSRS